MNLIIGLSYWLAFAFITERTSEIITSAKITDPLREKIFKWANPHDQPSNSTFKWWLNGLITCGYCTSVIIGCFYSLFIPYNLISYGINQDISYIIKIPEYLYMWFIQIMNLFMCGILLHGLSNLIHNFFELIRRGRVRTYDVTLRMTDNIPINEDEIKIDI